MFNKKFSTLYNSFYQYISNHKQIVLNGIVEFRMNNYFAILNEIVSEAVSEFVIEKEYAEFVSLLKLYINSQPTLTKVVHVVYSSSESILLDENKNIIEDEKDAFDLKYLSDINFSANDYTLNSLLNLLPKRIYVHLIEEISDEFINTIQEIFGNRVCICNECEICRLYRHQKRSSLLNIRE